ncbi:unnamed protein product [Adineta ricciae]|uniref:tRNA (guanine(10)-N(2))-methyltransferase TRMT11 n=1 Tax=Adineta ricciae TaxID=249248 RepID=A0A815LUD5_ADIRI|nr:unnamed protein product [Adineta ricciae]
MSSVFSSSPKILNELLNKNEAMDTRRKTSTKRKDEMTKSTTVHTRIAELRKLTTKHGVYSVCELSSYGFEYTGEGDTAICDSCGLKISDLTLDVNPKTIHFERSPDCSFLKSLKLKSPELIHHSTSSSSLATTAHNSSSSNESEKPSKRIKIEPNELMSSVNMLYETSSLQQVRRRTFSHWPSRTIPSVAQMIEAGFFNCNVGDRVICLYCNLICQQWTPHTDDPSEIHKTLSPKCPYVKGKLIRPPASSIIIVNEGGATAVTGSNSSSNQFDPLRSNEIVFTAACNPAYTEIPKRHASFEQWPKENLPSVDDLVRAGFFYTGSKSIVTCFYCNGSLQNWGPNDNPMIEHARWFPHCAYAKQLCGDDLYRKIQESKRAQQERAKANELRERATVSGATNTTSAATTNNNRQLLIPDESTLSRLVAARLDLPISQRLLDQNFKLSIIKRCWEDQLRLKQDDFQSECDLFIACTILQKQIEHIDGKKENIVIPSIKMKQIREKNEAQLREPTSNQAQVISNPTDAEMTTSSQSLTNESVSSQSSIESTSKPSTPGSQGETKLIKPIISSSSEHDQSNSNTPSNPCVLCLTEEKRLACIPCGHLATCVPCGHSLRSCPMCRREIEAFELLSLAEMFGFRESMTIERKPEQDPFMLCTFSHVDHLKLYSSRSVLLKSAYEYWTHGSSMVDVVDKLIANSDLRPKPNETWRILVHAFRKQFAQPEKVQRIEAFSDRLNITNRFCLNNKADCTVGLFENYEEGLLEQPKEVFTGRWICDGARHLIEKYDVRKRYFIGNTTMDATLSFVMANMAQCQPNHVALDPFCGTGGILLACAEFGSYVIGSEFDWRVLTAQAKPTKANTKQRARNPDEMMYRNFSDYGTLSRFLGVVGADFAYPPWRPGFIFDAIVSDPPYGIRESSQHKSRRQGDSAEGDVQKYDLTNIYVDLLNFANVYLRVGGRLVFWMPTHIMTYDESLLPTHPCFQLFSNDEQQLNRTTSRRLITMVKTRESQGDEKATVNEKLFSNFRDLYFTSNTKIWEQLTSENPVIDSSVISKKRNHED